MVNVITFGRSLIRILLKICSTKFSIPNQLELYQSSSDFKRSSNRKLHLLLGLAYSSSNIIVWLSLQFLLLTWTKLLIPHHHTKLIYCFHFYKLAKNVLPSSAQLSTHIRDLYWLEKGVAASNFSTQVLIPKLTYIILVRM